MGKYAGILGLCLIGSLGGAGCLLNLPLDGQQILAPADYISENGMAIDINGLWGQLGAKVEVLIYNYQTRQWEVFSEFYTTAPENIPPEPGSVETIALADALKNNLADSNLMLNTDNLLSIGAPDGADANPPPQFYAWGGTLTIPNSNRYWAMEGMGTMRVSLLARVGNMALPSLDSNSFACLRDHPSPDPGIRFQDCDSHSSPAAHVRTRCGHLGEFCCGESLCYPDFICDGKKICQLDSSAWGAGTSSLQVTADGWQTTEQMTREEREQMFGPCVFEKTKTSCKGVVLICQDKWVCPDGMTLFGRTENRNRRPCGACFGFDF